MNFENAKAAATKALQGEIEALEMGLEKIGLIEGEVLSEKFVEMEGNWVFFINENIDVEKYKRSGFLICDAAYIINANDPLDTVVTASSFGRDIESSRAHLKHLINMYGSSHV